MIIGFLIVVTNSIFYQPQLGKIPNVASILCLNELKAPLGLAMLSLSIPGGWPDATASNSRPRGFVDTQNTCILLFIYGDDEEQEE